MSEWLLKRGAIPLNPYYKPLRDANTAAEDDDNFFLRQEEKKSGDWERLRQLMKPVVHTDLRMVDHCDAIIVNLDLDKRPCGTWDEIITATNQNKPVLIHAVQGMEELPDWLYGRLPWQGFFNNWEDMKDYLTYIDTEETMEKVMTMGGRWKFFDYEPLVRKALGLEETTV
jgi:hypothetical protein